jgi:hypothetical protein
MEGSRKASGGVAVVSATKISWLTGQRTSVARQVIIGWTCPRWRPGGTQGLGVGQRGVGS